MRDTEATLGIKANKGIDGHKDPWKAASYMVTRAAKLKMKFLNFFEFRN